MIESTVLLEVNDPYVVVKLNRPHRLNAMVPQMAEELITAIHEINKLGPKVAILVGEGKAFCSGADLKDDTIVQDAADQAAILTELTRLQELTRLIRRSDTIFVSVVHGYALGAGCELALSADLVIAAPDALFGFPEASVGLPVTGGITGILPRIVGLTRAKQLLLTSQYISADRAFELGMVNDILSIETNLLNAAYEWIEPLLSKAPLVLAANKHSLDLGAESPVDIALENEIRVGLALGLSNDSKEGPRAFKERRKALFGGH